MNRYRIMGLIIGLGALSSIPMHAMSAVTQALQSHKAYIFIGAALAAGLYGRYAAKQQQKNNVIAVFVDNNTKKQLSTLKSNLFIDSTIINTQDAHGNTALMRAAFQGNTKLVKALCHAQADTNVLNKKGESALNLVIGQLTKLTLTLASNPDDPKTKPSDTTLDSITHYLHTALMLLEHNAQRERQDSDILFACIKKINIYLSPQETLSLAEKLGFTESQTYMFAAASRLKKALTEHSIPRYLWQVITGKESKLPVH